MSFFSALGNGLRSIAPTVATALGGPLAGNAVKLLSDTLFGKSDATEEEIQKAISSPTAEQLIKLKELDQNFDLRMAELDVEEIKIHQVDRSSARQREIDISNTDRSNRDPMMIALPVMSFVLMVACIGVLIFTESRVASSAMSFLAGSITTAWLSIFNYYYGSSSGSKSKEITIGSGSVQRKGKL